MKKINLAALIAMVAFVSCQKEQSSTSANNQTGQSVSSSESNTYKALSPDFTKHLVAYYPFSGNAKDKSGNGNNPNFNNATLTTDRFGNANSAYSFNGNGQYIKGLCTNYPNNKRTISVWFKIDDLSNHGGVMGYGGGNCGTSFLIEFNATEFPNQIFLQGHCMAHACIDNHYPTDSQWYNLTITSGNDATKLYLNGALIHTCNGSDFDGTNVIGKDFCIGAMVNPSGIGAWSAADVSYFHGALDDIVIYDWILTPTQVKKMYDFFSVQ